VINNLRYADDIVLIATSVSDLYSNWLIGYDWLAKSWD